jgi:cell division protein FtsQ
VQQVGPRASQTGRYITPEAVAASERGSVLPKFLRKPARQASRLLNGGFHVSGRGLAIFGILFAVATAGAGLVVNGQADVVLARVAPVIGLKNISYDITGAVETSQIDIMTTVAPLAQGSLLTLSAAAARDALIELPWVADATVTKRFPDRLSISITERAAFAIWQDGDGLHLVDREGKVLGDYDGRPGILPLVVGQGAGDSAAEIVAMVSRYPQISSRVRAYQRVGSRRWDLQLENGIQVLLPENRPEIGLARLVRLDEEKDIFNRAVERIDLRAGDRVVFRLEPGAADAMREVRERQMKQMEKAKRERQI